MDMVPRRWKDVPFQERERSMKRFLHAIATVTVMGVLPLGIGCSHQQPRPIPVAQAKPIDVPIKQDMPGGASGKDDVHLVYQKPQTIGDLIAVDRTDNEIIWVEKTEICYAVNPGNKGVTVVVNWESYQGQQRIGQGTLYTFVPPGEKRGWIATTSNGQARKTFAISKLSSMHHPRGALGRR
jgi:hypothetical protein